MSNTNLESKITIDENKCIICGLCAQLYPNIFEIKDNKIQIINPQTTLNKDIVDLCPAGAISDQTIKES